MDVKIPINAGTLAPRVANWLPKFDGILFPALGPIHNYKVQHLLVTWGRLKSFFFPYFSLDSSVKVCLSVLPPDHSIQILHICKIPNKPKVTCTASDIFFPIF
jgi:hypothetical protein